MGKILQVRVLLLALLTICLHSPAILGQPNAGNYVGATATNGSLEDMSGSTRIIGGNSVLTSSAFIDLKALADFDIWFMGEHFNGFSANVNGVCRFGNSDADIINATANTPSIDNPVIQARMAPFSSVTETYGDFSTRGSGQVHYKIVGTKPNRKLVIEWEFIEINRYADNSNPDATYQAHIYETVPVTPEFPTGGVNSGNIFFVYGSMPTDAEDGSNGAVNLLTHTGIGYGTTANQDFMAVDTDGTVIDASDFRTDIVPDNNLNARANVPNLHSPTANARRVISFTSPTLTTTDVPTTGAAVCQTPSTIEITWDDPGTTNGYAIAIYRSTDGNSFSFLEQVNMGVGSYEDTGLTAGTNYIYRLYVVSEGRLGSLGATAEISTSTLAQPANTVYAVADGNWSSTAVWSTGAVPTATDNVIIACGTAVSLDADATCSSLTIEANSSLVFDDNSRAVTVSGALTNNGTLDLRGVGASLSIGGNFTNATGSKWLPGESTVTFAGSGTQAVSHQGTSDYTFSSGTGGTTTVTFNGPSVAIPDGAGFNFFGTLLPISGGAVFASLPVTASGSLSDISVSLNIEHNRIADLQVYLVSPSGTRIDLYGIEYNVDSYCFADDLAATFDDDASNPVDGVCVAGSPAIGGTFRPMEALSGLNGEEINGEWRIYAEDYFAIIPGSIDFAQLNISYGSSSSTTVTDAAELAFNNVIINNTGGGVQATNSDWLVYGNATLTDGIVYTETNGNGGATNHAVIFEDNSTSSVATRASHIDGVVRKRGNEQFVFPIGRDGWDANIGITAPTDVTHEYSATYYKNTPNGLYSLANKALSITNVSNAEYWDLSQTQGTGGGVRVALSYDDVRSGGANDPSGLTIAHWTYDPLALLTRWKDEGYGGDATTAGFTGFNGVISNNTFTSFSPITLGNGTTNSLPVELIGFEAEALEEGVELTWETAQEENSSHFTLERSANGTDFVGVGEVDAQGASFSVVEYKWLDTEVNSLSVGTFYYRLKAVDLDGAYEYSKVKQVDWSGGITDFEWRSVSPNPFSHELNVSLALPQNGELHYEVIDATGRRMTASTQTLTAGVQQMQIPNVGEMPNGIYFIKVVYNGQTFTQKVVKQ